MAKEFLGRGWSFPVAIDMGGQIRMSEYEEDIKEAIRIILGTAKGERVMRPDFGCGIHDLVFAPINNTTVMLVEKDVQDTLTQWESRIELLKVEATAERAGEGKLLISIDYRVRSTNHRFNLVYPFYLKEGE